MLGLIQVYRVGLESVRKWTSAFFLNTMAFFGATTLNITTLSVTTLSITLKNSKASVMLLYAEYCLC